MTDTQSNAKAIWCSKPEEPVSHLATTIVSQLELSLHQQRKEMWEGEWLDKREVWRVEGDWMVTGRTDKQLCKSLKMEKLSLKAFWEAFSVSKVSFLLKGFNVVCTFLQTVQHMLSAAKTSKINKTLFISTSDFTKMSHFIRGRARLIIDQD